MLASAPRTLRILGRFDYLFQKRFIRIDLFGSWLAAQTNCESREFRFWVNGSLDLPTVNRNLDWDRIKECIAILNLAYGNSQQSPTSGRSPTDLITRMTRAINPASKKLLQDLAR